MLGLQGEPMARDALHAAYFHTYKHDNAAIIMPARPFKTHTRNGCPAGHSCYRKITAAMTGAIIPGFLHVRGCRVDIYIARALSYGVCVFGKLYCVPCNSF